VIGSVVLYISIMPIKPRSDKNTRKIADPKSRIVQIGLFFDNSAIDKNHTKHSLVGT